MKQKESVDITINDTNRTIELALMKAPAETSSNTQYGVQIKVINDDPDTPPFSMAIGFTKLSYAENWLVATQKPKQRENLLRALNAAETQVLFSVNWWEE